MERHLLMKGRMTARQTKRRSRGFTLVELLVVIGVIAAMSAVALPDIMGYVRSSRIRTAQDEVFSAVQRARAKAITTNAQFGVVFVIESPQVFWVHIEDPQPPVTGQPLQTGRQPLNSTVPNLELSTRYELDSQVEFAIAADSCPAGPGSGNQDSMRFDRYGVRTFPGFVPTPPEAAPPILQADVGPTVDGIMMTTTSAEASICLVDQQNGLFRLVTISAGGRVKKG